MLSGEADPGNAAASAGRGDAVLYSISGCNPETGKKDIHVKVSDISDIMNLPRPGVTRTVKEMEKKGYLSKIASPDDGRVTYISITEEGWKLFRKYDENYFGELSADLSDISEEDADCMIRTIAKFYQIMCERRCHYDK